MIGLFPHFLNSQAFQTECESFFINRQLLFEKVYNLFFFLIILIIVLKLLEVIMKLILDIEENDEEL